MFREMRRNKQLLPPEESAAILRRGTSGVLALSGDGGYPYAVPISYVYDGAKLYFHCARPATNWPPSGGTARRRSVSSARIKLSRRNIPPISAVSSCLAPCGSWRMMGKSAPP